MAKRKVAELEALLARAAAAGPASAAEARFFAVLGNSIIALALVDLSHGGVLFANNPAQVLTGYEGSELCAMKFWDLVEPRERGTLFQRLAAKTAGEPNSTASHFYTIRKKDGSKLIVEVQGAVVPHDGASALLVILNDANEKELLRRQLQEAQKMAAIGTMAAGIAHDFNNIIYGIMLGAETVQRDLAPGQAAWPYLEQIRQSVRRAAQLIRQLLSFSRRGNAEAEPLLLKPLIKEALSMLRATLPATVAMETRLCPTDLMVLTEPTLIQQVLVNLCTNAAQAMQDTGGEITLSLEAVDLDASSLEAWPGLGPGRYARLTVADNGPGMTPEVREKIFDPFFTTKPPGRGTGLGLSVVRGIMDQLQGAISVDSRPGHGAVFTVLIPLASLQAPRPGQRQPPPGPPRGDEHILVVDDEEIIRSVVKEVLGSLGYTVTTAGEAMEAMDLLRADPHAFDLVICDQTMPGLTGSALLGQMKNLRPDLPVILCTGHSDILDSERAKALGACDFMMKPLEGRELAERVARCLRGGF